MQCQVSKMTWEMVSISTLERLSSLTDVCMEYLFVSDASRNTMQSVISIQLLENTDESYNCTRGTFARDGCIYALAVNGQVLKIDTTNNSHDFVTNIVKLDHDNAWN